MDPATLKVVVDVLNLGALAAVVAMFVLGYLVSRPTLEKHILAPRDQRITALEAAMSRRDEDMRKLLEQHTAANEVQARVIDRLLSELETVKHERRATS